MKPISSTPPLDEAARRYRALIEDLTPEVLRSMPSPMPSDHVFVLAIDREGDGWGYSGAPVPFADLAELVGFPADSLWARLRAEGGAGFYVTIEAPGTPTFFELVSLHLTRNAARGAPC